MGSSQRGKRHATRELVRVASPWKSELDFMPQRANLHVEGSPDLALLQHDTAKQNWNAHASDHAAGAGHVSDAHTRRDCDRSARVVAATNHEKPEHSGNSRES
jgi:hypothetical protein